MPWIVEYGLYHEFHPDHLSIYAGLGPYSMAGCRWRDTLTDLADPTGEHTGDIPDKYQGPTLHDKLFNKKTPGWGHNPLGV